MNKLYRNTRRGTCSGRFPMKRTEMLARRLKRRIIQQYTDPGETGVFFHDALTLLRFLLIACRNFAYPPLVPSPPPAILSRRSRAKARTKIRRNKDVRFRLRNILPVPVCRSLHAPTETGPQPLEFVAHSELVFATTAAATARGRRRRKP